MLEDVLLNITSLFFMPSSDKKGFAKLDWAIRRLKLPSLESLGIYLFGQGDSPAVRSYLKCFLDIASRSKMAPRLRLNITCHYDTLLSVFP